MVEVNTPFNLCQIVVMCDTLNLQIKKGGPGLDLEKGADSNASAFTPVLQTSDIQFKNFS